MAFKSSKGRDVGKEVATWQSNNVGQGIGGGAGGAAERNAFIATGGTILDPGDGYIYHRLPTNPGETSDVFEVKQLNSDPTRNEIKIMLGGAGGGGGGGSRSDSGGALSGTGGSGGAVGAWTVPVTVGTYDQQRGEGGTSPFGPNGPGQGGPGGGGPGNPGGQSWFRASGDPNRQLTTPGGIGGQRPNGNSPNAAPPTPGNNTAISWTWSGGAIDDNLNSNPVNGASPGGGPSGGGPAPSDKWWKPIGGNGGGSGGNGGGGRNNPNNQGSWNNPGNPGGSAAPFLIRYPKAITYQPGIPGFSEP